MNLCTIGFTFHNILLHLLSSEPTCLYSFDARASWLTVCTPGLTTYVLGPQPLLFPQPPPPLTHHSSYSWVGPPRCVTVGRTTASVGSGHLPWRDICSPSFLSPHRYSLLFSCILSYLVFPYSSILLWGGCCWNSSVARETRYIVCIRVAFIELCKMLAFVYLERKKALTQKSQCLLSFCGCLPFCMTVWLSFCVRRALTGSHCVAVDCVWTRPVHTAHITAQSV